MSAMKPCPFCGAAMSREYILVCEEACCGGRPRLIWCPASECGCEYSFDDDISTIEEAIFYWNKRSY